MNEMMKRDICPETTQAPENANVLAQVTEIRDLAIYIDRNACGIKLRLGGEIPDATRIPDGNNLRGDLDGIRDVMSHALRILQTCLEYLG